MSRNLLNILSAVLILSAGAVSAQTPDRIVEDIRAAAEDAFVSVSYMLEAKVDGALISDEGVVCAQDDLWCLKGRTVEIYTCGDGTWILHPEAKEAMVEPKWTYNDLEVFYRTLSSASADEMHVKVLSKTVTERKPASFFVPETGSDWIVTDLR